MSELTPSEIGVLGAVCVFVISKLFELIKSLTPKSPQLTEADIKDMEYKTNLKGLVGDMKEILVSMSEKGDRRNDTLMDVKRTGERTHTRVNELGSEVRIISGEIFKSK